MSAFWQKLNTWRPIDVTPSSTITNLRLSLSIVLSLPKTFTLPGIVSDLIDVPVKQSPPRDVSVEGNTTVFRFEHFWKAYIPMVTTPSGIVRFTSEELLLNADLSIVVTFIVVPGTTEGITRPASVVLLLINVAVVPPLA